MRIGHFAVADRFRGGLGTSFLLGFLILAAPLWAQDPYAPIPPIVPPGFALVDDMLLPESVIFGDSNWTATAWTNGIVPFNFNSNVNATNQAATLAAMAEWEAVANVDFVPRTNQSDFIQIVNSTVNSSVIGQNGGQQDVNIVSWGTKYIIAHELYHALGFKHEQARPDRNNFVQINWNNISQTACNGSCDNNFQIDNNATTVGAYDFLSIMHYSRTAFTTNGQDTITCLPAFAAFQTQIGQRTFMTNLDAQGLASRYGSPFAPSITSITPNFVAQNSGTFTITVDGLRFFQGSPNTSGVQGSQVRWNGAALPTTFVNPTRLTATVANSLLSYPQNITITVNNPWPAGGESSPRTLTITCGAGANVNLVASTPQAVTNSCSTFTLSPVANQWNIVAITSTSDWDVNIGPANSWNGGGSCDFAVANGELGTITPSTGDFPRYNGSAAATAEFRTPATMSVGQVMDTFLPAGAVFRSFRVNVPAAGNFDLTVTGTSGLRWYFFTPGNSSVWRPATARLAVGSVGITGTTTVSLSTGVHLMVVCRHDGVSNAAEPFTINVCNAAPSLALPSNHNPVTVSTSCQPFSMTPIANRWNVVGITSASDWDVTMGTSESQSAGGGCDFLVADGRSGTVSPTTGLLARFSGSNSASAQHGTPVEWPNTNFTGGATFAASTVIRVYELNVTSTAPLDITFTGSSFLNWRLFAPGSGSGWRPKESSIDSGSINGGSLLNQSLTPGWYAFVIFRNGATGTSGSFNYTVTPTPNPVPVITAATPSSVTIYGNTAIFTVNGTGFLGSSVLRWNGVDLTTTTVNSTTLTAWVFSSQFPAAGTATLRVFNPSPGGGLSNAFSIPVLNPSPSLVNLGPNQVNAGTATFNLNVFGVGFVPTTVVRWNGTNLATTFTDWQNLVATVPAALVANAGTHSITVFTPTPGGGTSNAITYNVNNPAPVLTSISPTSAIAGSAQLTLTLTGSGFNAQSVSRWVGTNLATTFVNATQLTAVVPASLLVNGGTRSVTVFNPAPGGGTSVSRTFTINNLAPIITSLSPTSTPVGSGPITVTVGGLNCVPSSVLNWDLSTNLTTTFVSPTQLQAIVPASLLATAGTHGIRIVNPAPGGGNSLSLLLQVTNPLPTASSLSPASVIAGAPAQTIIVTGTEFLSTSIVRWNTTNLATTFVSSTQLSAVLPAALIAAPGTASVTVQNPAPGGGSSSGLNFNIIQQVILSTSPSQMAVMTAASLPVTLTLSGLNFLPNAVIHANGTPLTTTFLSSTQLQAPITPAILQTLRPGGIALNVAHGQDAVSNTTVLRVGQGANVGTIRRQPLSPLPNQTYSALLEGGTPLASFSLYYDLENPAPLTAFPDASANLVLAVGPLVGSGALFGPILEGLGLYGPPDGSAYLANGTFNLLGFTAASSPIGVNLTIQGIYLDPAATYGFRLTWARFPDSL